MKLSKSTTVLINVALVLVIAILAKSLIAAPKSANATLQEAVAPMSRQYRCQTVNHDKIEATLNEMAKQGWKFVAIWNVPYMEVKRNLIFER